MKKPEIEIQHPATVGVTNNETNPSTTYETPASAAKERQPSKWAILAIVAIGILMATLDQSIVNIGLPTMAHVFGVPLNGEIEWVVIGYLIAMAATLLTAGRLADMIGRKVIWTAGLIVFTTGSALCGATPTLIILIAARFFQGIGGALLMSVSPALLVSGFPANQRGRALGLNALIASLGITIGPVLGAIITSYFSWRWIFYVNVPLGILGLILTIIILPSHAQRLPGRFDPLGAAMIAIGLACLTGALSFGQEIGWFSFPILAAFIVGVVLLGALPFVEHKMSNPIIRLSLLSNRVFTSAIISLVLMFLSLFAVSFMLPFYLEELRGFSLLMAGLLMTPQTLATAMIAPFSGVLADRYGTRWFAVIGMTISCVGLILISFLNASSSVIIIIVSLAVTGAGQALFQSPNNSALMGSAPSDQQGSAAGFLATGRIFGQSLSIAIAGAIFTGLGGSIAGQILFTQHPSATRLPILQRTFTSGFHMALLVCGIVAAVGIFTSLVRGKETRSR